MNANTKSVKLPITDEVAAGVDCSDYRGWRAVARQLERDLMLERERAEKAEADAKHYHQKCEMLLTAMYEAEEKTEAELAALRERLERQDDCVRVPRELLTLWHRVMLQNSGEYEYKCADEMAAILAAEKEPK